MIKPVPLSRLSDISRQRSIRRPLLVVVPSERDGDRAVPESAIEWPLPG